MYTTLDHDSYLQLILPINKRSDIRYFSISIPKWTYQSFTLISCIIHKQWRNQGGGKWAIAHFIWRFAHWNFYKEVLAHWDFTFSKLFIYFSMRHYFYLFLASEFHMHSPCNKKEARNYIKTIFFVTKNRWKWQDFAQISWFSINFNRLFELLVIFTLDNEKKAFI